MILPLFAVTLFLSAALLFWVQPLFSKMALPLLGGTPAVWNTCLVFFQAALLGGYLYAHAGARWLGPRRQAVLHVILLFAAALALPVAMPDGSLPRPEENPIFWLLGALALGVGGPFLVVSATAPMLQRWFAESGHSAAKDPYFLYGASNLGSLAALTLFPLALEPALGLHAQSQAWAAGFLALAALIALCATSLPRLPMSAAGAATMIDAAATPAIATLRRLRWIALSFAPSSLLMGVTTQITTDIASAPLLWALPLALYLLSYVLVFARKPPIPHRLMLLLQPILLMPIAVAALWQAAGGKLAFLFVHLAAFFVTAMVCHGELARDRPASERLTEFYLCMSLGGVLGGAFNALAAPFLFDGVAEYPIALVAAALLRPAMDRGSAEARKERNDVVYPLALLATLLFAVVLTRDLYVAFGQPARMLLACIVAVAVCTFGLRPVRFAGGLAAVFVAGAFAPDPQGAVLHQERSFFGVLRMTDNPALGARMLMHGTTVHGAQRYAEEERLVPQAYFHPSGPIGGVFHALGPAIGDAPVGVIGLGAGTLACFGRAGQPWTFYEIDPAVVRIAQDPTSFTYLRDCGPRVDVVLGDARRTLTAAPDGRYRLFVLDAFSSDSIPMHLLTREAVRLYFDKLAADGVVAFHVSNRYLELRPILAALADELGLVGRTQADPEFGPSGTPKFPSIWAVMARRSEDLGPLAADPAWTPLPPKPGVAAWTDDYSNIVGPAWWKFRDNRP